MTMINEEAIGISRQQRQASSWIAIVLMGIWVPALMIIETVIGFAIFPLLLAIWLIVTDWSFGKIIRHFIWIYGRFWLWIISPFVRLKLEVEKPNQLNKPCVYVVNHLSLVDIFFLSAMPVFDVVICLRSWPFKIAWYTLFMRLAGYLDVEALSWEQILEQTDKILKQGHSVLVFPQGHRSRDGRLTRFYSGAFKLAVHFNVPIIPICIRGTDQMLPPGRRWMAPAEVQMNCLEQVEPKYNKKDLGHIELRKRVRKLMEVCLAKNRL
jgi:1-acyl-sn-glycerol-3-phosphate acyltransferase